MSQILKVLDAAGRDGVIEESDRAMIVPIVQSLAIGLFSLHVSGMIRFARGEWTIGEIEGALDLATAAFLQKLIESRPKPE